MELSQHKQFSKEQLINLTREDVEFWRERNELIPSIHTSMRQSQAEIALAMLTAPDFIPPHVEDAMGEMCDGGFNAQGIWSLCRKSLMPPKPCPRCGTASDRPDGVHYCHVGRK